MIKAQGRVPAFEVFARGTTAATTLTGTTSETVLATVTIPGGTLGANGLLYIRARFTCTSSANIKNLRVRLGGLAGAVVGSLPGVATSSAVVMNVDVWNRNSQSAQLCYTVGNRSDTINSTVAQSTTTVNTALDQDLVITGALASSGESIVLEGYVIEVVR